MARLYYRYGVVSSAKTLNLLAVAHNYQAQGKRALIAKPAIDDRFGLAVVKSRAGLEKPADFLLGATDSAPPAPALAELLHCDCLLVDEAQFLSERQIDHFRFITDTLKIPVICYGLRTDFRTQLFPGSKRLMEVADKIEEVKTTCAYCNCKGVFNLRLVNGGPTLDGPSVDLGADERYQPVCSWHYRNAFAK